ncbi:MAG: rhodanese-like domain-containing protein [bacterium]
MEKQHVHETNPKRTFITVIIFLAIIVIGLLTIRNPELKYVLSPDQTVELVTQEEHVFYPYELEYVISGEIDTILLIDIRDRFEFGRGHIEGAENISAITLLNRQNIKRLEQLKQEGMTVVIYGNDQLEANGPWMVYRQLGFDNVKLLLGGYNFYRDWKDQLGETYYEDSYLLGAPRYNFAEVAESAKSMASDNESEAKKPLDIQRRKKTKVAEGGC